MTIRKHIKDFIPEMNEWRHYIHENPEIAYEEHNTSDFIAAKLTEFKIQVLGDETIAKNHQLAQISSNEVWFEEFLDYKIVIGEIASNEKAIEKINKYSGGPSSAIITKNYEIAKLFMENVGTAAVYHNASTRFTDGAQFGLGAEIGIATTKLHAYGPMGLESLTSEKYLVNGEGQIRD